MCQRAQPIQSRADPHRERLSPESRRLAWELGSSSAGVFSTADRGFGQVIVVRGEVRGGSPASPTAPGLGVRSPSVAVG